ncbi:elongator complex protein-like protein 1 [Bisporella sp. PMI_857]|nr:elongator complex protein-like protein 1 [Bisporella sp. PMI_857]
MRNLRNIRAQQWHLPTHFQGRSMTASTWDLANDSILCTVGPTQDKPLIELIRIDIASETQSHSVITSWDAPSPNPDLEYDTILSLHYFGDNLTACLVLAGGDIVVVREEPLSGEDRIEIVGSVDAGITAAKWSPDEELLAIATKADTIVFMSRNFESITDITMTSEDLKASNHVSVGWGKKETQFKGKGAKALQDPTIPEKTDEGVLSPNDDGRAAISWRGDGAYLAISTVEGRSRRLIRVYSREGVLDSVSEPVDGLEGALSWRPAGNLIASVQRFVDHVDIVFFERNGLRHGQFSLRLTSEQLLVETHGISLSWNSDSTALAVVMPDRIQLWTMGNYHWYLKQEFQIAYRPLLFTDPLIWHPEKALRILTVSPRELNSSNLTSCGSNSATESLAIIEYIFTTARGSTIPPDDQGVVTVIDGQTLKITPFKAANVPPPMAHYEILLHSNIVDIALNADASIIAILHQSGVSVFEWKSASAASLPILTGRFAFPDYRVGEEFYQQISISGHNEIHVLSRNKETSQIKRIILNADNGSIENLSTPALSFSASLLSSFSDNGRNHSFTQNSSGGIHSLDAGNSLSQCKLPMALPWVDIIPYNQAYIAFGMSSNGHLYANSRLLVKNCTSFLLTQAHLILTTTTHLIKFVHITSVENLEIPPDDPETDERCRSIERGARLVTAIPTTASVILQMPRGNLETIFPRAMVIAGIRALIEEKNYKKAFTNCRTQRVDMNILYDHAPEQFLANVPLFIDQVKKITYIDLFLSSLREEDVTQTMYKETRVISAVNGPPKANDTAPMASELRTIGPSKVNKICDTFLGVLKTRTATNLQNIITANVCKSPPALDDGLKVVAFLMHDNQTLADKAVEHICFLADVNKLYENALGLYNLELALLVAQQSQKDPREYLPFMQNLQEMSELRRKFVIDDYLGRHTKALIHLHTLDAFDEIQKYTQKHLLYKYALALYRYNPSQHAILTELYAQHLEAKSKFKEAGLAYESLPNYPRATSCYLSSGASQWRETLFCALSQTPPVSGSALQDLATSLYDALIESKDYFAAASIQLDYLSSVETAVRTFCKGYLFADAMHLVAIKSQPQLLESLIDPGLGDALASSTELLAECKAQLQAQVPRIRELRAKALADPLAFYEGERGGDGDIPDDVSVAASSRLSTNRSLFTRYTGKDSQGQSLGTAGTGVSRATSKNRRREERKRARGKKGSVYEEEYLISSIGRLIERVESVRADIDRLVAGLVRRGMWERARAVEGSLADVVAMCQDCIPEVFGMDEPVRTETEGENEYRPTGGDAVLQESIDAAGKRKQPPHVVAFQRLSLLGT